MEKTFKVEEILEIYQKVEEFVKEDKELPAQFTWNLEENEDRFKAVVTRFEKHRNELFSSLNDKGAFINNEDGTTTIKSEFIEEFKTANEKLKHFLELQETINIKTCSKDDVLPENISAKNLRAIKFMLTD